MQCNGVLAQGLDASPAGIMISHGHPKGGWMVTYSYMNMLMKNNLSGTQNISDDEIFSKDYVMSAQKMNMDMHMLMGMYGLTGRVSLMLMVSYTSNSMDMLAYSPAMHMHGGMMDMGTLEHTHETSGLNDTKLWALVKLLNGEGSSLVFSAGINFPTGDFQISAGEHAIIEGEHQPYMMQLGSGSTDLMPGLTYFKKAGKLSWSVQALSVIRPFENSLGYHFGNELTLNAWGAYQIIPLLSASLRAEEISSTAISGADNSIYIYSEPGSNPVNSGGMAANLYAGINFYINKSFLNNSKAGVEYGLPVYQNLNGIQISTHSTINLGITKAF